MGMFKTGTHVMCSYLEQFVRCRVRTDRPSDGYTTLPGFGTTWKHDPVVYPLVFPKRDEIDQEVVVILCIRELTRWLCAMTRGAYQLFPAGPNAPKKRKPGQMWWLLDEEVELRRVGGAATIDTAHARTRTRTRAQARARTHACARTHTRAHARARVHASPPHTRAHA